MCNEMPDGSPGDGKDELESGGPKDPLVERLGEELRTQDGRCTAHPYFIVQERVRDWGFDIDYSDSFVWVNDEDEPRTATEEEAERLEAGDDLGSGWRKVYYRDRWEFVQAMLTERAAKDYVDDNGHRHSGELRVYAESAHRNPEIQALREHFLARLRTEPSEREHRPSVAHLEALIYLWQSRSDSDGFFGHARTAYRVCAQGLRDVLTSPAPSEDGSEGERPPFGGIGVHASHCCPVHGCRYHYDSPERNEACPVVKGEVEPAYPDNNGCEECEDGSEGELSWDLNDPYTAGMMRLGGDIWTRVGEGVRKRRESHLLGSPAPPAGEEWLQIYALCKDIGMEASPGLNGQEEVLGFIRHLATEKAPPAGERVVYISRENARRIREGSFPTQEHVLIRSEPDVGATVPLILRTPTTTEGEADVTLPDAVYLSDLCEGDLVWSTEPPTDSDEKGIQWVEYRRTPQEGEDHGAE